jgi:dipeptidyl-peptidase-4
MIKIRNLETVLKPIVEIGRLPGQAVHRGILLRSVLTPFLTLLILIMNPASSDLLGQDDDAATKAEPLTVAEQSEFKSTSTSQQVVDFVETCDAKADHVRKFVWGTTVEGRDMVGAIVSRKPYELGDEDDRNVVLLLGNIHSGECAGKEALLMMLRELTYDVDHEWLDHNVIVFAPNYNADANDRMGKRNRPGQIGPENGMGRRENAQQLDLNRDFCKIESPEARALVRLIDQINPHLFVDCHTTNGSKHRYALTYDVPHNPTTAPAIREFLRERMMPEVTLNLDQAGVSTFYYGNLSRDNSQWTTYGHEPRYSTEYVGLRGRLAVLSEAYSYISYRDRIEATKAFVSELLNFVTRNQEAVHKLLDSVDQELVTAAKTQPQRVPVSLDAKVTSFELRCKIKGFKDGQPHEYECEFVGKYEPLKTTQLPYAYLLPEKFARVADRLKMHGVKLESLVVDTDLQVEVDTFTELNRSQRAFQKHKFVQAESDRNSTERQIPAGTYVIRTGQPLGRFLSYMLESASDDGFVFWNFFDDVIEIGGEHPVLRLPTPVKLQIRPVDKIEPNGLIDLSMIDGPNSILDGFSKSPKWFGQNNWLTTTTFGREFLMDAESASFLDRPARLYAVSELTKELEAIGLHEESASDLANEKPEIATNGKVAVFANDDHAVLYYLGQDAGEDRLLQLAGNNDEAKLFDFNLEESRLAYSSNARVAFV